MWRDIEKDPPPFHKYPNGNRETDFVLMSTPKGEMAVASIYWSGVEGDKRSYKFFNVSGVSGYEWEFDLERDITHWMELPSKPE